MYFFLIIKFSRKCCIMQTTSYFLSRYPFCITAIFAFFPSTLYHTTASRDSSTPDTKLGWMRRHGTSRNFIDLTACCVIPLLTLPSHRLSIYLTSQKRDPYWFSVSKIALPPIRISPFADEGYLSGIMRGGKQRKRRRRIDRKESIVRLGGRFRNESLIRVKYG